MGLCHFIHFLAIAAFQSATYGEGTGAIFLSNVNCIGTETRLLSCSHSGIGMHNCVHSEDACVKCEGIIIYITIHLCK